jgi:hypothetical protein
MSMIRRTPVFLAAFVFILVVSGVGWRIVRPKPVITPERVRLIEEGMTRSEVEALLGGPPGDYSGGYMVNYSRGSVGEDDSNFSVGTNWWGREGMVQVQFNQEGRAEDWGYYQAHSVNRVDFWGKLRDVVPFGAKRNRHGWVAAHW